MSCTKPGRIATALALGACLVATVVYLRPPTAWLRAGTIHVAPDGFDALAGSTRQLAVRTIQRAADLAAPGETILVWPGTYRERIHLRRGGRPGRPVVLRAAVPGTAVISGVADQAATRRWRWSSIGARLHRTRIDWRADGLRVDGVPAFQAGSLELLRNVCARPGAWPAFHSSEDELVVCLPDGSPPQAHSFEVNLPMTKRTNSGGHQVASLWLEASDVEIRDLVFDFPVMAAIQLWNTNRVRIEGNRFSGADVAVNQWPSLNRIRDLVVTRNLSEYYPLYEWRRRGWLTWREVYPYCNSSLTWVHGENVRIEANVVTQAGDGIKVSPLGGRNVVAGNLIALATDDGIEFDGPAVGVEVVGNLIAQPFDVLGTSPVSEGPVRIENNLFLARNEPSGIGSGALLKLMGGPIRRVSLRNNVFVGDRLAFTAADSPLTSIRIEGNLLATVRGTLGLDPGTIEWRHNRWVHLPEQAWPDPATGPGGLRPFTGVIRPLPLPGIGPSWLKLGADRATRPLRPFLDPGWIVR